MGCLPLNEVVMIMASRLLIDYSISIRSKHARMTRRDIWNEDTTKFILNNNITENKRM